MRPSFGQGVAAVAGLGPILTIAAALAIGLAAGTVAECNPFLAGCTDITHTGMVGIGGFVFRGGMIGACAVLVVWWLAMDLWLAPYGRPVARHLMTGFGILGAVGLWVGTAVLLPAKADSAWKLHVQGANLFFQGMVIAMNLNFWLILRARRMGLSVPSWGVKRGLLAILWLVMVAFAIVAAVEHGKVGKSILEWWSVLFICLYFLSSWPDWKRLRLVSG